MILIGQKAVFNQLVSKRLMDEVAPPVSTIMLLYQVFTEMKGEVFSVGKRIR